MRVEETRHIDAHHRRRNHAEVGERRVAPADALQSVENVPEAVALGHVLHVGSRIGNGDEAIAGFGGAQFLPGALEEVLLENVGFQGAAGLARHDEDRALVIDPAFDRPDLRRIGGIEYVQFRRTGDLAEGQAHDLGTKAGSAHAQQQRMFEPGGLYLLGDCLQVLDLRQLVVADAHPPQPVGFVGAGPQRGVAAPQPPRLLLLFPVIERSADGVGEVGRHFESLAVDLERIGGKPFCARCACHDALLFPANPDGWPLYRFSMAATLARRRR